MSGAGGCAYINAFDAFPSHAFWQPAFVFTSTNSGAKFIAEASSHEAGHTLALHHDGTPSSGYYLGHGSWAPIMGVGYYRPITQWSKGEYGGANNQEDDVSLISTNGAPLLSDDHGDSMGTATTLSGTSFTSSGLIGGSADVDVFEVSSSGGLLSVTVDPAPTSPNLDVSLEVRDANGISIASADPPSGTVTADEAFGLSATVSASLGVGTYYVYVDGTGYGNPSSTGYSDYGSLGQYTLSGSIDGNPACYPLSVSVSPAAGGSVSASPSPNCGSAYTPGTVVQLTAAPSGGYTFDSWSGDATGSANPVSVTMDGARNVTANFISGPSGCTMQSGVSVNATVPFGTWAYFCIDVPAGATQLSVVMTGTGDVDLYTRFDAQPTSSLWNCRPYIGGSSETCNHTNPSAGTWWVGLYGYSGGTVSVTATYTDPGTCYPLTVSVSPAAGGSVAASPTPNCGTEYTDGTVVQLTASSSSGYTFDAWSGDATGSANPVSVTMNGARNVTANFVSAPTCYPLSLSVSPAASGSVTASPSPNCGSDYSPGTVVQLTASPSGGYTFDSWSGDATGSANPVSVTMDGARNLTANFISGPSGCTMQNGVSVNATVPWGTWSYFCIDVPAGATQLSVVMTGTGDVDLYTRFDAQPTSSLWNCRPYIGGSSETCNHTNPSAGTWWAGLYGYSGGTVSLTATYTTPGACYPLTLSVSPAASGSVTASPAPNCGTEYTDGTVVQLTASAASGYAFANWSGDATGTSNPVTVTMNAAKTVTANFSASICYPLTLTVSPAAGGSVTANPSPNCGTEYTDGTVVQLTATAANGYAFANWSGDATGTSNPVTVTMNAAKTVTANFSAPICYPLTLTVSPAASGSVTASPAPNCGTEYTDGTVVQLTATAASGYAFANWSGDATGTSNPVSVTMNAAKTVTGNFSAPICYPLTLAVSPAAGGTVTASPTPNCGTEYTDGTVVQLTGTAASGYAFANWSGDATGTTNPVSVTMDAARTVTGNFSALPPGSCALQSGVAVSQTVGYHQWEYFCIDVPSGSSNLTVTISGTGDVDLYTRFDAQPTSSLWNCRPYIGGSGETCTHNSPSAGTWWVGLYGYSGGTVSLTATYTDPSTCHPLSVSVSPAAGGSVTASPAPNCGTEYTDGTIVQLTATAASGYTFDSWSGDATGSSSPVTVTMDAAKTVTANFSALPPGSCALQSGVAVSQTVGYHQWEYFCIDVPAGSSILSVTISGTGDVDLYTRFGSQPTSSQWDCRPYIGGSSETCNHTGPSAGTWWVGLYGYSGGTVSLTATYTNP